MLEEDAIASKKSLAWIPFFDTSAPGSAPIKRGIDMGDAQSRVKLKPFGSPTASVINSGR